ncbi:MAG: adenylate kinase [Porphyromonadaceae bacterium CG2_30_38_12]|nr:MAG: adenylate kinase [Porphyromonadaceae bacterium CG2_30_38_12]
MLNFILCGAPGCGKGTQSTLLVEKYNLKHLSTGDLLREEINAKTEVGIKADSYISVGNLAPDDMIIAMLLKAVDENASKVCGFILDGFPRTVAQASALEDAFEARGIEIPYLIDMQVDKKELITRLIKRGETSGRSDDNLDTIKKRLEIYETKTAPVNDFYKNIGKYRLVDGMGEVEEIFERISAIIDKEQLSKCKENKQFAY